MKNMKQLHSFAEICISRKSLAPLQSPPSLLEYQGMELPEVRPERRFSGVVNQIP